METPSLSRSITARRITNLPSRLPPSSNLPPNLKMGQAMPNTTIMGLKPDRCESEIVFRLNWTLGQYNETIFL
jgi:hypothetical protein